MDEWVTASGLKARICQCVWSDEVKGIASSLHDFFTGYVQTPDAVQISDSEQDSFDVHGGVTFTQGKLPDVEEGEWIGFDMHHVGDDEIKDQESYARAQCEKLAEQIKTLSCTKTGK